MSNDRGRPNTAVVCLGLRAVLDEAGLTVEAAAARCGWGRARVQNWIAAGEAPRAALEQLAGSLGLPLQRLMDPPTRLAAAEWRLSVARRRLADAKAALAAAKAEVHAAQVAVASLRNDQ